MSKLKKIAKYACGGKMPKHLYGGRIATHKDELEEGGPIEPPGVSLKRRPGSKKFSAMSDEELIELAKEYHNTANSYQRELDSLQARSGRKGKTKPTTADKLRYSAIELLFGDSSLREWDMSQFEKNKKARRASVNPESYMLPQGTAKESTRVSRLLELVKGGSIKGGYESYDLGGFLQNIAPLMSAIPGAGAPIGAGVSALGQLVEMMKSGQDQPLYQLNQMQNGGPVDPNPYRNLKRRKGPAAFEVVNRPKDTSVARDFEHYSYDDLLKAHNYTTDFIKSSVKGIGKIGDPPYQEMRKHLPNAQALQDNLYYLLGLRSSGVKPKKQSLLEKANSLVFPGMQDGGPINPSKDKNPYRNLKRRRISIKDFIPGIDDKKYSSIVADIDTNISPSNYKDQTEWMKNYISSPIYREILTKETGNAEEADRIIRSRISNVNKYPIQQKKVHPKGYGYRRGLSVLEGNTSQEGLKPGTYVDPSAKNIDPYVGIHELTHSTTQGAEGLTDKTLDLIKNSVREDRYGYYSEPSEVHARLTELKKLMSDYKIVNPAKNKITKEHLLKALRTKGIRNKDDIKDLLKVVDEKGDLLSMLNSIAYQPSQSPNISKLGGYINNMKLGGDFKQYAAPTHESGGQLIDANGNPTTNMPVAEIEKNENSYDGYVFSDTLINPDTGDTFAKDAKKVANKTKRQDDISKSSRILQLMKLRQSNEMLRKQEQVNEQGVPMAWSGLPYRDEATSLLPDLSIPLSTSPGIAPIYGQLPTRGGVTGVPRPYPYNRTLMTETQAQPQDQFYTVTGDKNPAPAAPAQTEQAGLSTLNSIAAGLKGAALGYGAIDALRRPEQEKLRLPDYSKGDQYFRGLEIDLAPALNEINMGATKAVQDTSNQAGGIGARNSRVNAILSRAGKNAASVQLQQQQANAGIRTQIGSREDMKSQSVAGERIRQQTAQSQNEAQARLAERKFFSDLSQVGTTLNNIQMTNDMMKNQNEIQKQALTYGIAMLNQKYPDFKVSDDFIERFNAGTLTEADKPVLDQIVQFARRNQ